MTKYPKINIKHMRSRQIVAFGEFDDPRQLYHANKAKEVALYRLEQTQKERDKMDEDMDNFNVKMMEFTKFVQENSFKIEEQLEIIDESENIIEEEKRKQNDYNQQIASIDADIEELMETARLAKLRIESYRPYEEFVSRVIATNPRYQNVFDIIKHVEEMACIRKLGSKLKISVSEDDNDDDNDDKDYNFSDEIRKDKVKLIVDFNDARTHLGDLKRADLTYLRKKTNPGSEYDSDVDLNQVDPIHLTTDLELMKAKRKDLETEIPKQQIMDKQDEHRLVIGSILHQYRELYYKNNEKLPVVLPSAEDQLTYIFEFYKKTMKRLEVYKNLETGRMTLRDYISKSKE